MDSTRFQEGFGRDKESITLWGVRNGLEIGNSIRNSISLNNEFDRVPKIIL